jgi:translocation and assembly module TamB
MTRAWYIAKKIGTALVVLALLCALGIYYWLQTEGAREEIRHQVASFLERNLGLQGTIDQVEVQAFPPRAHVLGGEIMGGDGEPLLRVDRITVSLQPIALLQGTLRVAEITLEEPVLRLVVEDRRIVNLPQFSSRQGRRRGTAEETVGDLGVLAGRVEVLVRDAPEGPLSLVLDNSNFDITLEQGGTKDVRFLIGEGSLAYRGEQYEIRQFQGRVLAEGDEVHVRDIQLAVDDAVLVIPRGSVGTQAPFDAEGQASVELPLDWVRRLPVPAPPLTGQAAAQVRFSRRNGRLEVDGDAAFGALVVGPRFVGDGSMTAGPHAIGNVTLDFRYNPDGIESDEILIDRLAPGDGSLVIREFSLSLLEERLPLQGQIEFRGTELAHILIDAGLYASRVRTQLEGRASLRGFLRDFRLRFLPLELRTRNFEVLSESILKESPELILGFPDGFIRGKVVIDSQGVRLRNAMVGVGQTRLAVTANFGFGLPRRWWLRANTVPNTEFRLADIGPIAGLTLGGVGSLSAHIHGPYNDPIVEGQVNVRDFTLNTLPFGRIQGQVHYRALLLSLPSVSAQRGDSRYRFDEGRVDFRNGLSVDGVAQLDHLYLRDAIDILQVEGAVAQADGLAQGQARVHFDNRRSQWEVDVDCRVADASYAGHSAGDVEARVRYEGGDVTVESATVRRGPGRATVSGTLSREGALAMDIGLRGMTWAAIEELPAALREMTGNVRGRARLYGTTSLPRATGWLDLSPLAWRGNRFGPSRVQFQLQGTELQLSADLAGRQIRIDEARLLLQHPYPLALRGRVHRLELSGLWSDESFWGGLRLEANGTVDGGVDLANLWAPPAPAPAGRRGSGQGQDYGFAGLISVENLVVSHPSFTLRNRAPLQLALRRDRAMLPRTGFVVTSGRIDQATAFDLGGWVGPKAMGLELRGQVDLGFLPTLVEPIDRLRGTVHVDCRVGGSPAEPLLLGEASFEIRELGLAGLEHRVTAITGGVRFSRNALLVENLSARLLGGTIDGSGRIVLSGFSLSSYRFAAALYDARLPLGRYSSAVLNGTVRLQSAVAEDKLPLVSGDLELARLRYAESIDLGLNVEQLSRRRRTRVRTYDPEGDLVRLDLRVQGANNLRIENNVARANVIIDDGVQPFRLVGTNQNWSFLGTLRLQPHGSITFRNTEFDIDRAVLEFRNPYEPDPAFDFVATAVRREWQLRLRATGTRDDLSLALSSEPPLSEEDIALLLAVGLTREETQQLGYDSAASSALPELLWSLSGVDDEVSRLVPVLDELRITTDYSRRSGRTEPRVRVARRLSDDVRLGASAGLTETRDFDANLEVELDENLSFEAVYENDNDSDFGNIGGDLRWLREF